jgi:hypothetical protein
MSGAEERIGEGARGTARRQQDHALRHFQRIGGTGQPLDRDRVEEGSVRREEEEVHRRRLRLYSGARSAKRTDPFAAKSDRQKA